VPDAGARAHDLDVAGFGAADVADAVLVGDGSLADIGDDLHVLVAMKAQALARSDLVVVPHDKSAQCDVRLIAFRLDDEMVLRGQPSKLRAVEGAVRSKLQHA